LQSDGAFIKKIEGGFEDGKVERISPGSQSGESWNGDSRIVVSVKQWTPDVEERECMMGTKYMDEFENSDYTSEYEFMSDKYPEVLKEWIDDLVDVLAFEYGESRELENAIEFAIKEAEEDEMQEAQDVNSQRRG